MKLKIAREIDLPLDAVTQTMAAIGRKGAGKTYLATMIAEQMLDAKSQIVVVDPVGNWWGLRVNADGKTKGKEIFVIGGDHGDVPLIPEAGKRIAQLVVEKGVAAILDVSSFGIGERKRFCADFAEEFFHLKKKSRTPVHVFLEEAQLMVPQTIRPDEARMYSAFEQIVRLGRNYGIGCTLITQRPQSVNKEVLSQVECLCVLQITGPHERKALEYWVQEAGIEAPRTLIGELPGLARGEGYVWSPSWLKKFERVHFSKKTTFDSSATPEIGKAARAASLSAVDVEALKNDLAEVIEQAEKDDPAALRRKIVQLQSESKKNPMVDPAAIQAQIDRAVTIREKEIKQQFDQERAGYRYALVKASQVLKQIAELTTRKDVADLVNDAAAKKMPVDLSTKPLPLSPVPVRNKVVPPEYVDGKTVTGSETRVLNAVAWMNSIGVAIPEKPAVAFVAGYSPSSSGFHNTCGSLRSKGYIEYAGGGVTLTPTGQAIADVPAFVSVEAMQDKILAKLGGSEAQILRELIRIYPEKISREELAMAVGKSPESSGFHNTCGRLRTFGLVEYPAPGQIKGSDILFPSR